jgi:hypothetical protein
VWNNRLAVGKHSAIAGVGGKGKSQVLYYTSSIGAAQGLEQQRGARHPICSCANTGAASKSAMSTK